MLVPERGALPMILWEVFMDIFGLKRQGLGLRAIARKLGIHRNTVRKYLEGRCMPSYRRTKRKDSILAPYQQVINDWLEEDSYQATWIIDRLRQMSFTGSYDTVKRYVRKVKEQRTRLAYLRFETQPGHQAQADWGDFQIQETDGKTTTIYLFALLLGFSRVVYAEFVERCTLETFLDCHIRGFRYLRGVPGEILYDNMKHVVVGKENGRVVFNTEFLHFAYHYQFTAKPCPAYSPWVKGKVERPIDYIRERFWRGYRFESVEKTNGDLLRWLDEVANERTHGTHREVVRSRWEREIAQLGKLPVVDYDTSLKVFRKVYKDCQISYNATRYLVPHGVVGKKVMLKIKGGIIRIYHDQDLLITHQESTEKGSLVGDPRIYEALKEDRAQRSRKYGRVKGRATRGLSTGSLYPQVQYRPLGDYDKLVHGGAVWSN
jgi:transposase